MRTRSISWNAANGEHDAAIKYAYSEIHVEQQQNEDIANAPDINPLEAEKLQVARENREQLTQEQKDSLRKFEPLQSRFVYSIPTIQLQ